MTGFRRFKLVVYALLLVTFGVPLFVGLRSACGDELPRNAERYRRDLVRESQAWMGLAAPVCLLAGQIHQESRWNPQARSPVGAQGLTQFMPATARWLPTVEKNIIGVAPFNPQWAIRALVLYDRRQYSAITRTADDCERWAMTLSAYNGGLGWVNRDRRLCAEVADCDPSRWWGQVEKYSRRAKWALNENRAYPRNIIRRWQSLYQAAGWCSDPEAVCP